MRAAWYDERGSSHTVLQVGELPDVQPGAGEVRLALAVSGISPGDVKKRDGWQGAPMAFPRVIPHSDGAGRIDAVGPGVDPARIGRPAWCYGAQSYRAFGTAAQFVIVPAELAIDLPEVEDPDQRGALLEQAACLGIAGITAHRAVTADGPVKDLTVLVHGAVGGVGSIAAQLARAHGARVIALVRPSQLERAATLEVPHVLSYDDPDLQGSIRAIAPEGVHRIAEVDLAAHVDLDAAVIAVGGSICSYYSSADRTELPYWTLGFADATLRLLGSDDFPSSVKAQAASDLTDALVSGQLRSAIAARLPLDEIASAHELVEHRTTGRVLLTL